MSNSLPFPATSYFGRPLPARDLDEVLGCVGSTWERLRDKTILLTGGTGFIGIWLLETLAHANVLLSLNARVIVYSRHPEVLQQRAPHLLGLPCFEFVSCDVRQPATPSRRCDYIIHAATEASAALNSQHPELMADTIVNGTIALLRLAKEMKARLLFLSSGAIYGTQPPQVERIAEDICGAPFPVQPASAYADSKRLAEQLCFAAARDEGVEIVIARGFAFVGPHLPLDTHFAIGNFIRDVLHGRSITIQGDGTPYRSYLYAGDMTSWLWVLLIRGVSPMAYNVGSPEPISIGNLARLVAQTEKDARTVTIIGIPNPKAFASRYVPDVARAESQLQLRVHVGLAEAIRRTSEWYRSVLN